MNILIMNDLHSGSDYALVEKKKIKNAYQEWVYPKYDSVINYCNEYPIHRIGLVGDMVEGYGHRDSTNLWTTDVDKQIEHAVNLLKPLVKSGVEVFGVGGSGYHRGKGSGFDGDKQVIEKLGGKYNRNSYYLNTPYGIIQFIHTAKRNIKGEAQQIQINNGEIEGNKVKLLVAGHLHRYEAYEVGSVNVVHTPCWQYPTDFMQGFGVSPTVDIGCLIIHIDEFGISLSPIKFPIPFEVMQEMAGWEDVTEKEIKQRHKEEMKRLSELTGVSTEIIQVIKNKERKPLVLPNSFEKEIVEVKKKKRKKLVLPK